MIISSFIVFRRSFINREFMYQKNIIFWNKQLHIRNFDITDTKRQYHALRTFL